MQSWISGFIYDVKCSRIRINRYDTKLENMGPNECKVKPLGVDDDCRFLFHCVLFMEIHDHKDKSLVIY